MQEQLSEAASTRSTRRGPQLRRNPRLRLACARCQRRKIRCDGALPECTNCRKAGVGCADGASLRLRDPPRESLQISILRRRISWLESIVKDRLPDVDLSQGPAEETDDAAGDGSSQVDDSVIYAAQPEVRSASETVLDHPSSPSTGVPSGERQDQNGSAVQLNGAPAKNNALSHEIGLVSVGATQDLRYIGPSSGYFLARMLLSSSTRWQDQAASQRYLDQSGSNYPFATELVEAVQEPLPLPAANQSKQLCDLFFETINVQYPILHRPSFETILQKAARDGGTDPVPSFQVFMVLAIAGTVLSRRSKATIPAEAYSLSALKYFDRLNVENSLEGLQCLLLLLIFTMHNPHTKLNVWYLNYQCIAAVLDLGLQRDIRTSSGISLLDQEMRTRIFWVVFTLDRTIATMMGRPIGLRDEACELRLPLDISDADLSTVGDLEASPPNLVSPMSFSLHLFKLARLNSEIKYVANSIVRGAPPYAYPAILNIHEWHKGMLSQLDLWAEGIPQPGLSYKYIHLICQVRYHTVRMVLLRPSPAIPNPSVESLLRCHESACASIGLFDQLYRSNLLDYSWTTLHSLILSTITLLYCIRAVPSLAQRTELDVLLGDISTSLSILSATGEYWSGAKRSRDILDDLARATVRWLKELDRPLRQPNVEGGGSHHLESIGQHSTTSSMPAIGDGAISNDMPSALLYSGSSEGGIYNTGVDIPSLDELFGTSLTEQFDTGDCANVDTIVRSLFEDFIPNYQFSA